MIWRAGRQQRGKVKAKAEPGPSRFAPLWPMLIAVTQALILAVAAFAITGRIELTLKDRQATIAGVQAMDKLLTDILAAKKEEDRRILVGRLSMFGADAIDPLIVLTLNSEVQSNVLAEGLALVAVRHARQVCRALKRVAASAELFPDAKGRLVLHDSLAKGLQCAAMKPPWYVFWNELE